ncbi:MAG: YibE/F family protein [Eubacteriales bacterium]
MTNQSPKYIKYIVLFLIFLTFYIAVDRDYALYEKPIAQITAVNDSEAFTKKTPQGKTESYYNQKIRAKILSGIEKDKTITLYNTYAESLVYDEKYKKGMKIFISAQTHDAGEKYKIRGIKRDTQIASGFLILFLALIIVGKGQGLASCICLVSNISILTVLLLLNKQGLPLFPLAIIASILFSCIIIFLINSININSFLVLIITLTAIALLTGISAIALYFSPPLEFEFLEYLSHPYEHSDANLIFLTELLMGSTGVIIDIAMTIVSFATQMLEKRPDIQAKTLIKSCALVSEHITGTMINVVFFTNLAGSIPLFLISLKNEIGIFTIFRYNIYFEAVRFFVGGISILLTIPLSAIISAIYGKRRQKSCLPF